MTLCRHFENRIVPISCGDFDGSFEFDTERFHLLLIKSGYLICRINGNNCFINGKSILCLSKASRFEYLDSYGFNALHFSFAPEVINPHLDWGTIFAKDFDEKCKKHHYPKFEMFFKMGGLYLGVLSLDDLLFHGICEDFKNIEKQLTDQLDKWWSCRSRHYIFSIMSKLEGLQTDLLNPQSTNPLFSSVRTYILNNLKEAMTIETLSGKFHTNHTTLYKIFKKCTRFTVPEYINQKRLDLACNDLAFGRLSLSEIAEKCGFNEQSYFSRVFKQEMGITPLQYRQITRKERDDSNPQ